MGRAGNTSDSIDDDRDHGTVTDPTVLPFARARSHLEAALRARHYAQAAEAAREGWFDLLGGPAHDLTALLERIPQEVLEDEPVLAALLGRTETAVPARRLSGLRRLTDAAAGLTRPGGMRRLDRALIHAGQAESQRTLGRTDRVLAEARSALVELDGLTGADARTLRTIGGLYAELGAVLLSSGADQEALDAFERGMLHSYAADPLAALGSVAMLAVVHAGGGDLTQAREYIHVARSSASALRPDDAAALRLAEASVALEQLDVQAATGLMDAAADQLRTSVHWIPAAVLTGMIELAGGHPGRGLAHLDHAARARGAEGRTEAARRAFAPLRALLRLALGHPDSASAILERDAGSPTVLHIGRARAELMLGRHGAALQQLRALSSTVLSTREHANVIALESAALLRFSNERRVGDVVDHLGSLLQRSGLRLPLALLPEPDFDRVADALTAAGYADLLGAGRIRPLLPELGGAGVLSRRETAVLAALVEHPSHTAIAAQLNVSVNTVKSQLRSVYRKLGVSTRDEAIAVAIDRHLLVERE